MQVNTQRYHESQMIRLYEHYGSAVDPQPVVVDWETQSAQTASGDQIEINTLPSDPRATIRQFDNVSAARAYVEEDGSAQLGGVGDLPSERVGPRTPPARSRLGGTRAVALVPAGADPPAARRRRPEPPRRVRPRRSGDDFVKTFERVPGATIEGSGAAPGEEVEATVELEKATGGTFEYTQYAEADENGNFEFTVPYSTTGYDEFGPENGYTNTSVRATGPYNITTAQTTDDGLTTTQRVGQVEVTEGQVVGADDAAATVELTEEVIDCPSGDPECFDRRGGADGGDGSGSETATVDSATVIADATGVDATHRRRRRPTTRSGARARNSPWRASDEGRRGYLKGVAMGSADAVPGVSGGTIALIVGIYERLIAAVTAVDPARIRRLLAGARPANIPDARAAFHEIDGAFLFVLLAGIGTAVVAVLSGVDYLLETRPVATYGFFFGLIAASAAVLFGGVSLDTSRRKAAAIAGFARAFLARRVRLDGAFELAAGRVRRRCGRSQCDDPPGSLRFAPPRRARPVRVHVGDGESVRRRARGGRARERHRRARRDAPRSRRSCSVGSSACSRSPTP